MVEEVSGVPRWVKVFIGVAAVLAVLGVVVMLLVGGVHGPGRHSSAVPGAHDMVELSAPQGPA